MDPQFVCFLCVGQFVAQVVAQLLAHGCGNFGCIFARAPQPAEKLAPGREGFFGARRIRKLYFIASVGPFLQTVTGERSAGTFFQASSDETFYGPMLRAADRRTPETSKQLGKCIFKDAHLLRLRISGILR